MRQIVLVGVACALAACGDVGEGRGASASNALASCNVGNSTPVLADDDTAVPLGRIVAELGLGDDGFGRIVDVALTAERSLVVADGQVQEADVFSHEGERLGTFSRRGSGPGEFNNLRGIVTGPDGTVHLTEPARAAEFSGSPVPQHVETSALGSVTGMEGIEYRGPELVAVLREGSVVLSASRPAGASDPPPDFGTAEVWPTGVRGLLISSSSGWRELTQLPANDHIVVTEGGRRLAVASRVRRRAAPSFSATDSSVLLSFGSDYTIRELDASGATLRSWTVCGLSPRELTEADIARFIDAELVNVTDNALAADLRSMFESMSYPPTHPAVHDLVYDRSQRTWIQLRELDQGDAEIWGAFTTDGVWLGTFQAPLEVEIWDIRDGTAAGVRTDEFGVQSAVILLLDL